MSVFIDKLQYHPSIHSCKAAPQIPCHEGEKEEEREEEAETYSKSIPTFVAFKVAFSKLLEGIFRMEDCSTISTCEAEDKL